MEVFRKEYAVVPQGGEHWSRL